MEAEKLRHGRRRSKTQLEGSVDMQWQRAGEGFKVCKGCGDHLELYLFPADKSSPGGRFHLCCPCRAEAYRESHPTRSVLGMPSGCLQESGAVHGGSSGCELAACHREAASGTVGHR